MSVPKHIGLAEIRDHMKTCEITLETMCSKKTRSTDDEKVIADLEYRTEEIIEDVFGNRDFTIPPESPFKDMTKESLLAALHQYKDSFRRMLPQPTIPRNA